MRASRYPVHLVVLHRADGHAEWRQTTTVNISSSGVLFVVDDPLPVGSSLEFRLVLPPNTLAAHHGEIYGHGRVARVVEWPAASRCGCAIAIEQYEFRRGSSPQYAYA